MKINKKIIAGLCISMFTMFSLVGCSVSDTVENINENTDKNLKEYSRAVNNIVAIGIPIEQTDGDNLSIVIDKRTGVQYLHSYRGGFQVILDKDGKPLIDKAINALNK